MTIAPSLEGRSSIRMGYVGSGFLAQLVHLPNFAALPGCELIGLAEVREELGRRVQKRFGIPRLYRDHLELIADPEIDAVGVSAPYALQGEIARDCLAAGKHVFMEKPMAICIAQAERILAAGRGTRARLMVGYMKRYDAGNILAQRTIAACRASGELGRVTYARAHGFGGDWLAGIDIAVERSDEPVPPAPTVENLPEWLPAKWGSAYVDFLQQFTHNVNLLRFLLDAGDRVQVRHVDLDQDGYTGTTILDVDGVRATLETGRLRYHGWDEHTQVYFERGWVHTWSPPLLHRGSVAEVEIYRGDSGAVEASGAAAPHHTVTRPVPEPRWSWSYQREAAHFVECLRAGKPFGSSGEDTLTDVRLFEEIYRRWLNR